MVQIEGTVASAIEDEDDDEGRGRLGRASHTRTFVLHSRVLAFFSRYGTPHHTLRSFLRRQRAAAHCLPQLLPRAGGESAEACALQLPVSATRGNRWQRLLF